MTSSPRKIPFFEYPRLYLDERREIMSICQIPESKTVGKIKSAIENAILEGEIDNTYEASFNYLMKITHHYLD